MERIQDFILAETNQPEEQAPKTRKKAAVDYEIVAKTNADVVVKRKTPKTEKILAIIPSKGQYYVSENGMAEDLIVTNMVKFFASLEEPLKVGLDWLDEIEKGKGFAEDMLSFVSAFRKEICAGIVDKTDFQESTGGRYGYRMSDLIVIYRTNEKLALFLKEKKNSVEKKSAIRAGYSWFQPFACGAFENRNALTYLVPFASLFGLDKTRLFVERMIERDLNFECSFYTFTDLLEGFYPELSLNGRNDGLYQYLETDGAALDKLSRQKNAERLDADAFIDYCCSYQFEGFTSLSNFFFSLKDDWKMQRNLYGKIREKYPKNLSTHHDKMSLACSMMSHDIDEHKMELRYETLKKNEWENSEYIIIAPKTVGDIVDEATQQANCLRTYLDVVANGQTSVYFLRKKKTPDESLVTVEAKDGMLVQIKGKFNKEPSLEQKLVLSSWAKAKGLDYDWQGV